MLCEEKERQQEKLYELKREILLKEREEKLDEELVKQVGFITVHSSMLKQHICYIANNILIATRVNVII